MNETIAVHSHCSSILRFMTCSLQEMGVCDDFDSNEVGEDWDNTAFAIEDSQATTSDSDASMEYTAVEYSPSDQCIHADVTLSEDNTWGRSKLPQVGIYLGLGGKSEAAELLVFVEDPAYPRTYAADCSPDGKDFHHGGCH
jgi:hypothetical protein